MNIEFNMLLFTQQLSNTSDIICWGVPGIYEVNSITKRLVRKVIWNDFEHRDIGFVRNFHRTLNLASLVPSDYSQSKGTTGNKKLYKFVGYFFEYTFRLISVYISFFFAWLGLYHHSPTTMKHFQKTGCIRVVDAFKAVSCWLGGLLFMAYAILCKDIITAYYTDPPWRQWLHNHIPMFMIITCIIFWAIYIFVRLPNVNNEQCRIMGTVVQKLKKFHKGQFLLKCPDFSHLLHYFVMPSPFI